MKIRLWCLLICGLLSMVAGCGGISPSSTYYLLGRGEVLTPEFPHLEKISIGVGPVTIPGHVDRPEIVTRTGQNTIAVNEFHRWGTSLEHQFKNILAMNLSGLLQTPGVVLYPWERALAPGYQVVVTVLRFEDGSEGAHLDAVWQVKDTAADLSMMTRRFSVAVPVDGPGVDAYVTAQTRAVEKLSRDIAKGLFKLASGSQAPGD